MDIYLDDQRTPLHNHFTVVRTFYEFEDLIQRTPWQSIDSIQFDHDLGGKAIDEYYNNVKPNLRLSYNNILPELTGYHCARWLVDHHDVNGHTSFPTVYTHSSNPIGAANIQGLLNTYFKVKKLENVCTQREVPFEWADESGK